MHPIAGLSSDVLVPLTFVAFSVGITGLAIWAGVAQTRKVRANLQQLADRLGLTLDEPAKRGFFASSKARVVGTFRGRAVQFYTYATGSGKSRTSWCALSLRSTMPPEFSLKISGENLFTKAGRMLGFDDVATGDPAFDDKFYVKSTQPDFVRAALIPEIRLRLLDAWRTHRALGSFVAEGGEVKYAEMGTFANARICARMPAMLDIAADLAEIAEACRG